MKKGLRLALNVFSICLSRALKPCPDEEGIKTGSVRNLFSRRPLKPCPDEEGIKTFLPSMLWSAFIVIAVWPGLTWLKNRLHWNRTACALLLAAALIGFVIGPLLAGILALAEHGETLVLDTKAVIESIPDAPPV